ncbi:MAG TPA: 16S rRNA pseudouridine(516) synthase, partial [Burkholderiaceae bacterium]|nr:16S rRNA pseudouridine(516) synthase [Burkholderiaceae bacterium]
MRLEQLLYSQGFGSRRQCADLVHRGAVSIKGRVCDDPDELIWPTEAFEFSVGDSVWPYFAKAVLLMHKPAGFECSQRPAHHPSVYSLLPEPLRFRGVQCVGRLDVDTTGLLLLTDDGALIHRLTSPKRHVPKVYEIQCAQALSQSQLDHLTQGVVLHDEPKAVRPTACERTGERSLRMTLTEGKYHQVKRMVAAIGNQVAALHRSHVGQLALPSDLSPGQWRWL